MTKSYKNINEIVTRELDVAEGYVMIHYESLKEKAEITTALAYGLLKASRTRLGELLEAHPRTKKAIPNYLETIQAIDSLLEKYKED